MSSKPSLDALRIERPSHPESRGGFLWLWLFLLLAAGGAGWYFWSKRANTPVVETAKVT